MLPGLCPGDEFLNHTSQVLSSLSTEKQGFIVSNMLVSHAAGVVNDYSNCSHTEITMPGTDDFSHCAHANNISSESAKCSNLSRGLKARAETGQIHAISKSDILIASA